MLPRLRDEAPTSTQECPLVVEADVQVVSPVVSPVDLQLLLAMEGAAAVPRRPVAMDLGQTSTDLLPARHRGRLEGDLILVVEEVDIAVDPGTPYPDLGREHPDAAVGDAVEPAMMQVKADGGAAAQATPV